jgi:hypothetical protein
MYTLLQLTREVKNAKLDRRARYGGTSVETFAAGTLIRVYPSGSVVALLPSGQTVHAPYEMNKTLFEAGGEPEPRTANEALFAEDVETHNAKDVLQHLLDKGLVSVDQLRETVRSLTDSWMAE